MDIWVTDEKGKKLRSRSLLGAPEELHDGERLSLVEDLYTPWVLDPALEWVLGSAHGDLRHDTTCDGEPLFHMHIVSSSWEEMVALRNRIRRTVYGYEPMIVKPDPNAPAELPLSKDPSFVGGVWWVIRGIGCDLRRIGQWLRPRGPNIHRGYFTGIGDC